MKNRLQQLIAAFFLCAGFPGPGLATAQIPLDEYARVEADLLSTKRKYFKKFGKVLPASKVFRLAQLDNRLHLATRVGLAACMPMLPVAQPLPAR
jgi:hypothetical protein